MTDQWWSPARQPPQSIPFRNKFDAARDPLTARNAIGAVDAKYVADAIAAAGGGGGGAPTGAEYITSAADATLTAERVLINTATITWDFSTAGQAKANTPLGAGPFQPLDGDLTAIAALTGTDTIYYRSGLSSWSAVTIGTNLTFAGGTLSASGGGGGTPGGSNTQVQFNDGGSFGGDADLTWNKTTNVLTLTGQLAVNTGNATSVTTQGLVQAASFKCTGTNAVFSPETSGSIALRPAGPITNTGWIFITTTNVTMTSPVTLPSDPTSALHAATKQYVDGKIGPTSQGQCYLSFVSTTQIKLSRKDGSKIKIAGTFYDIPSAGVTAAPTGLTAATAYNVYLFNSAGTLTLEFSTTAHSPDTTAGNEGTEIKTGDATRTLVGKVWITTGPVFNDSALVRGVLSWFNRRQRITQFSYSGSTTAVAFTDAGTTATFLVWGDEDVFVTTTGVNYGNGALSMSTQIVIDTGTGGAGFALASGNETTSAATNYKCTVAGSNYLRPAEGKHTLNHQAAVSSGTGTWTIYGHAIFLG